MRKETLLEVKASLEGYTVSMLRDIVRKDSTIKGVSRMRKAELIDAAATVVAKLNPEVVETEAVEQKAEITVSSTRSEIQANLEGCTKAEMLKVLSECTDGKCSIPLSWKKAEIAHRVVVEIERYRAREAFRALTLEEKYEYLTSQIKQREVYKVFGSMTDAELLEIARRLGIDVKDSDVVSKVMEELERRTKANRATQDIVFEYNEMVDSLMEKSESELRAEIRELCDAEDIAGYTFEGYEQWSKVRLVRELTDWYLFNSPDVDDELTSVYYEKEDKLPEVSPAAVSKTVNEATRVMKSEGSERIYTHEEHSATYEPVEEVTEYALTELESLRCRFEGIRTELEMARLKYEAVKAVNSGDNRYLLMVLTEQRRKYQRVLVRYRKSRRELRSYEAGIYQHSNKNDTKERSR